MFTFAQKRLRKAPSSLELRDLEAPFISEFLTDLTFAAMPDLFTVHAASLDDSSRYAPQVVTYGVRGHTWDHVDLALPKFEKMPTA